MNLDEFDDVISERTRLISELDTVDDKLYEVARQYVGEPLAQIPCGVVGEIDVADAAGITFTHDCFDHGYDLHDHQTWELPMQYIADPDGWREQVVQERAKQERLAQRRVRDAELREYRRLRQKFEPAEAQHG